MPVVGLLSGTDREASPLDAIWQGLKEADYVEGRNVAMEYRWAEGQPGQPPRRSSVVQCQAVAS
jgi:putative ABC transport system substrate-binding protein